jgi:hypothetical protein
MLFSFKKCSTAIKNTFNHANTFILHRDELLRNEILYKANRVSSDRLNVGLYIVLGLNVNIIISIYRLGNSNAHRAVNL